MTEIRSNVLPETITVPTERNGPAGSANGGVAAGLLGSLLPGAARVRLYRPPPLGLPMVVRSTPPRLEAWFEGELALSATNASLDLDAPTVTLEEAAAATAPFVGHAAPVCFVCGPDNPSGLHLFPGPLAGAPLHATTWTPELMGLAAGGPVPAEVVWGALDCPGAVMLLRHYSGESFFPALGTITAEIFEPVEVGEMYAVVGWPKGRDGRKLFAGTAIIGAEGRVRALSDQVCIAMPYEWGGTR
jgi:hypothetical protein